MESIFDITSCFVDNIVPCVPTVNTFTKLDEDYKPVLSTKKCGCLHKISWIAPADSHVNSMLRPCLIDYKSNSNIRFLSKHAETEQNNDDDSVKDSIEDVLEDTCSPRDSWGWYEDNCPSWSESENEGRDHAVHDAGTDALSLDLLYSGSKDTPPHVLEESVESQLLWNFSEGLNRSSLSNLSAEGTQQEALHTPSPSNENIYREVCRYTAPVTKTFSCNGCGISSTVMISIPRFQVVRSSPQAQPHAEFLVIIELSDLITVGVWRRFTHFKELAESLFGTSACEENQNTFRMSQISYNILQQRMRFGRCLDKEYLELKCFLLERFLHDVLFESQTVSTLRKFFQLW